LFSGNGEKAVGKALFLQPKMAFEITIVVVILVSLCIVLPSIERLPAFL
jgi:hypothetical protein